MIYKFSLGRHQLTISFGRKRGRPYSGHPFSRLVRHFFESKKSKRFLGLNLAAISLLAGVIVPPISAFSLNPKVEVTQIRAAAAPLTTEVSVRLPVDSFQITQGYHLFHQAIDLKEVSGAPVYPIMDGVVEKTIKSHFGYGNHLVISHGSGFKSLYAHLSKIIVKEGEKVDKNTVIGTVGSTGWTTGSHLHLEVYDNGRAFNPLTILK